MKKIGLLLTFLFLSVVFVKAQPGNFDPEEMIKRQVEGITEACDLSEDQVTKVEAIIRKSNEKMMALFQEMGGGGDREAMREKMGEIRDEQTKEIKAVLTEEQAEKYDEYMEEMRQRMRQGRPGGPPGGGPGM